MIYDICKQQHDPMRENMFFAIIKQTMVFLLHMKT